MNELEETDFPEEGFIDEISGIWVDGKKRKINGITGESLRHLQEENNNGNNSNIIKHDSRRESTDFKRLGAGGD